MKQLIGISVWILGIGCLGAGGFGSCWGQEDPGITFEDQPYDGLQAGQDAYERGEELRQQQIADQASLVDYLQAWRNGAGSTVYYRPPFYRGGRTVVGSEATFGNTWGVPGGYDGSGYRSRSVGFGGYYVVPSNPGLGYYRHGEGGGLYRSGYTIITPAYPTPLVRQPIGQWQGQTGPNRWESHPIYQEDVPYYRPDDGADNEEFEAPAAQREPIVKPKIIVPPREY